MSERGWPAIDNARLDGATTVVVEHAVWGKVHGQRSDFRWIAKSPGFNPRLVGNEFRISAENMPASFPLWRFVDGRYYAIWCYLSPARDHATRSNFLEKQLLEWTPDGVTPPAAVACSLLALASTFTHQIWFDRSSDPRWIDPQYVLAIPSRPVAIRSSDLQQAVAAGSMFWRAQSWDVVAKCYASLDAERKPAFLTAIPAPVSPAALAALLLPLPRRQADRVSMAGWIPSNELDDDGGGRWDIIVGHGRTADAVAPTREAVMKTAALRTADPHVSQNVQPWVQRLLDFADDGDRWLEKSELTSPGEPASPGEQMCLEQAVLNVRADAQTPQPALSTELAEARRKQLEYKADVIEAAWDLMSGRRSSSRHPHIQEIWGTASSSRH